MSFKKQLWVVFLLSALLFLIIGCSKDEENPVAPAPKTDPPEFQLNDVTLPSKMVNSSDEKAKQAISLMDEAMSFEGTGCVFNAPDGATVLSEGMSAWEYSWKEGNLTKRLAITSLSSINQRKWQLYYTGSADGVTYSDDWRFMDAGQTIDQSGGHVYIYKANTKQIIQEWTWRTEKGVYTFEKSNYADPKMSVEIVVRADNSGKVERFVPSTTGSMMHDLLINWNASGDGTWWVYQNGMTTGDGSWN